MKTQKTDLYEMIRQSEIDGGQTQLSESQRAEIAAMIGARCRAETKARIVRSLQLPLQHWQRFGIYSRVFVMDDGSIEYCCGQDYAAEMKTIRECLLGRF